MTNKRKIFPVEELSAESQKLFDVLNTESDLACVLIGASYLDQCLASMLERFFVDNKKVVSSILGTNRPLGTYAARCDLVYLLGLINSDVYKDLKTIGKIRNKFAHSHLEMTFKDEDIKNMCKNLLYSDLVSDFFKKAIHSHPRNEFTKSVSYLLAILLASGLSIKHRKENTGFLLQHVVRVTAMGPEEKGTGS